MVKSADTKNGTNKQTLQEKIVGRTTNIVHLTHNDLDAAGSDAICRMTFGNEIFTLFSSVGRFSWFLAQVGGCNGKGDTLIISDLSYQNGIEDQIRKAHAAGWVIQWYDLEKKRVHRLDCGHNESLSLPKKKRGRRRRLRFLWKHQDPRSAKSTQSGDESSSTKVTRITSISDRGQTHKGKCRPKKLPASSVFAKDNESAARSPGHLRIARCVEDLRTNAKLEPDLSKRKRVRRSGTDSAKGNRRHPRSRDRHLRKRIRSIDK